LAFSLVLLLLVPNNTMECHEAQLFQNVMLNLDAFFILQEALQYSSDGRYILDNDTPAAIEP